MSKKLWKILGGVIGIGAIACIIPACVVSCGSSSSDNTTKSSTPTTTKSTSSTTPDTISSKTTTVPSYPKTNPYYMLDNTSNTSTLVSEPTTPSPLDFYLGGSNTPNTSVQLSANDTYNINLQLNPTGQSDEGSVLSSYKTSPTLLAIVPSTSLTTTFGGKTTYTFNNSQPLLLQAVSGDIFQTNNLTDNTTLNNVSLPMYVANQDNGQALTEINLPIPNENGRLNFGLTPETFKVDINNTPYTINLEVNFSPYLFQATTPLTASDFNLMTKMSSNPNIPGCTYTPNETYQKYYTTNLNILNKQDTLEKYGLPAPEPASAYNSTVWLNWDGILKASPLYLNDFKNIVKYIPTTTLMTDLLNIAKLNHKINTLNAEVQQLNQYEQTIQTLKNTNSQDQNTINNLQTQLNNAISQATTQIKADEQAQTDANNTLTKANTQIQNDENTIQNLQNEISQDNQLVQQLKYLATTELPNSVSYSYTNGGIKNNLDNATVYSSSGCIWLPEIQTDNGYSYNSSVSATIYQGTVNANSTNPIPARDTLEYEGNYWQFWNLMNGSYTLVTQVTVNGMTSKKTYTPFTIIER